MSREDAETHTNIVGWLHIILSVLGLLAAAFVLLVIFGIGLLVAVAEEEMRSQASSLRLALLSASSYFSCRYRA